MIWLIINIIFCIANGVFAFINHRDDSTVGTVYHLIMCLFFAVTSALFAIALVKP